MSCFHFLILRLSVRFILKRISGRSTVFQVWGLPESLPGLESLGEAGRGGDRPPRAAERRNLRGLPGGGGGVQPGPGVSVCGLAAERWIVYLSLETPIKIDDWGFLPVAT